jgi:hypothetical protein
MQQTEQYTKLVNAIEFFSQRFSLENMLEYIFDFSIELIHPASCILIVEKDGIYEVENYKGAYNHALSFLKEPHHNELVYFHAGLINEERLNTYIPSELFLKDKPKYAIPLIMGKSLLGFVAFYKEDVTEGDLIIAEALMNLFSLSLSNYESYNALEQVKKKLDAKVFNLFAINQASKALLSELDVGQVIQMTNSVFSELTQSRITSIYIFDDIGQRYECMNLIDVYNKIRFRPSFIHSKNIKNNRCGVVIDYDNPDEKQLFSAFFSESMSILDTYETKYIINLIQDGYLLGFVTLSRKVNESEYESEIFELIESLASATYIAVANARNMEALKNHRQLLHEKFTRLQVMNNLVKNLNLAEDIENLGELTLETLKVAFGYKSSCFALFNQRDSSFQIQNQLHMETEGSSFSMKEDLEFLKNGKAVIKYSADDVASLLAEVYTDDLYESVQGAIIVPLHIDHILPELLGVICLFSVEKGLMFSEENLLTLETIANHIAPIVKQLNEVENVRLNYIRDEAIEFVNILSEFVDNMRYSTESFYIILAIAKDKQLFHRRVVSDIKEHNKYTFSLDKNTLGILAYTDEAKDQLCDLLSEAYTYEVLAIKDEEIPVVSILKQIEKIVFPKDV